MIARLTEDREEGLRALQYGTTQGDPGLRARLIEHLERNERVPAGTFRGAIERTVVTQGSQQLLYLIAEALHRSRRHRPGRVADLLRLSGSTRDPGGTCHRGGDRRRWHEDRRPGADARRPGGPGAARPGQADLLGHRALQPDGHQHGGGAAGAAGRAGPAVLGPERQSDLRPRGRRVSRPDIRRCSSRRASGGTIERGRR